MTCFRHGRTLRAAVLGLVLAGSLGLAAPAPAAAGAAPGDGTVAVTDWSLVAQEAIAADRPPGSSEVLLGIVQVAVYDAVVAIHGGARPFAAAPEVARPASTAAAVATAAHHVLVARVPAQAATVEPATATTWPPSPTGRPSATASTSASGSPPRSCGCGPATASTT